MENSKEQLCWSCKKACGGHNCEWANELRPVKGWFAEKKTVIYCKKPTTGYRVIVCPKFERG